MWKISQVILIVSTVYAVGFCGLSPAETWAINALSLQPLPSSHPVPAPQVRSHDFWRYINACIQRNAVVSPKQEKTPVIIKVCPAS